MVGGGRDPIHKAAVTRFVIAAAAVLFATFGVALTHSAANAAPPSGGESVPAAALHVAKSGSDSSGTGSAASPWKSITRAVEQAPSGATIVVHAGTYREEVVIRAKRLTLISAPGDTVWLSGSDIVAGWAANGSRWSATPAAGGRDRRNAFDSKQMLSEPHWV